MEKTFTFASYEAAEHFVSENNDKALFIVSEEQYDDSYSYYKFNFIVCDEIEANRLVGLSFDYPYCYGEEGTYAGGAGHIFQIIYRPIKAAQKTKRVCFKPVRNMAEREYEDGLRELTRETDNGELVIIELTACGEFIGEIRRAGNIKASAAVAGEIMRDYASEIVRRFKGYFNEYPMVTLKIVDNAFARSDKQNVLFKREYWVEIK